MGIRARKRSTGSREHENERDQPTLDSSARDNLPEQRSAPWQPGHVAHFPIDWGSRLPQTPPQRGHGAWICGSTAPPPCTPSARRSLPSAARTDRPPSEMHPLLLPLHTYHTGAGTPRPEHGQKTGNGSAATAPGHAHCLDTLNALPALLYSSAASSFLDVEPNRVNRPRTRSASATKASPRAPDILGNLGGLGNYDPTKPLGRSS